MQHSRATLPLPAEIHAASEVARARLSAYDHTLPQRQMQAARDFMHDSASFPGAALSDAVAGMEFLHLRSQHEQLAAKIAALRSENAAIEATMPALVAEEQRAGTHRGHIADVAEDYNRAEQARCAVIAARHSINRNLAAIQSAMETQQRLEKANPLAFQR